MYGKSGKHHESHCFLLFWQSSFQDHLKQNAKMQTPHPNCGRVSLSFIIISLSPEKIHKFSILWKIKETQKTLFVWFWWSSIQAHLKQIAEIKPPHLNCMITVSLTIIIPFMLPQKFTSYFSIYGKSRKHYEKNYFLLFWWSSTQAHLKQISEWKHHI